MGGDKGLEAGRLCCCLEVGRLGTPREGERRKHRKPMESSAASMRVIGLARRMDRAIAMMGELSCTTEGENSASLVSASPLSEAQCSLSSEYRNRIGIHSYR